jgi:hypothetical protein
MSSKSNQRKFFTTKKISKTKMQKKTETPTETSPVRKATGAMRCYHLPDEARHQIMRILNLCTTKNIAQLFQAKTPISILSLISSTTTPAPSSPHLVTLTSNTYALCFSAEMIKSFLVTIINARIHEPVLHRCRLIPTLTNHIPRLREGLLTWFIELLSPSKTGFFHQQRQMVGLVVRRKVSIPFLGALVCEFLWPLQRFAALNGAPTTATSKRPPPKSLVFFTPQEYMNLIPLKTRQKRLTGLLTHMVLSNEFVGFTLETVLGEYLHLFTSTQPSREPRTTDASDAKAIRPNILLLKYACTLVLQVINNDGTCYYNSAYLNDGVVLSLEMGELKRSLSALSLKNIIWLKNVCVPLKDIKGVEGYNIRAFLSSLPDDW